jgi:hypothetical protein
MNIQVVTKNDFYKEYTGKYIGKKQGYVNLAKINQCKLNGE